MAAKKGKKVPEVLKRRQALGLNQAKFWNPIGITQSGGSRYEGGRRMPPCAVMLYMLAVEFDERSAIEQLRLMRGVYHRAAP